MGTSSKGIIVIRVARNDDGRWNVLESDFEDPLAAFDDRESASDYANKLSASREETTVVILDDTAPGDRGNPDRSGIHQRL